MGTTEFKMPQRKGVDYAKLKDSMMAPVSALLETAKAANAAQQAVEKYGDAAEKSGKQAERFGGEVAKSTQRLNVGSEVKKITGLIDNLTVKFKQFGSAPHDARQGFIAGIIDNFEELKKQFDDPAISKGFSNLEKRFAKAVDTGTISKQTSTLAGQVKSLTNAAEELRNEVTIVSATFGKSGVTADAGNRIQQGVTYLNNQIKALSRMKDNIESIQKANGEIAAASANQASPTSSGKSSSQPKKGMVERELFGNDKSGGGSGGGRSGGSGGGGGGGGGNNDLVYYEGLLKRLYTFETKASEKLADPLYKSADGAEKLAANLQVARDYIELCGGNAETLMNTVKSIEPDDERFVDLEEVLAAGNAAAAQMESNVSKLGAGGSVSISKLNSKLAEMNKSLTANVNLKGTAQYKALQEQRDIYQQFLDVAKTGTKEEAMRMWTEGGMALPSLANAENALSGMKAVKEEVGQVITEYEKLQTLTGTAKAAGVPGVAIGKAEDVISKIGTAISDAEKGTRSLEDGLRRIGMSGESGVEQLKASYKALDEQIKTTKADAAEMAQISKEDKASMKSITSLYDQSEKKLMNNREVLKGTEAYDNLRNMLDSVKAAFEEANGDASKFVDIVNNMNVGGIEGLAQQLKEATAAFDAFKNNAVDLLKVKNQITTMYSAFNNAPQALKDSAYGQDFSRKLLDYERELKGITNDADLNKMFQATGRTGESYLRQLKQEYADLRQEIVNTKEAEAQRKAEAKAEAGTQEDLRMKAQYQREYNAAIAEGEAAVRKWSTAEHSKNEASRKAYAELKGSLNELKIAYDQMQNGGDIRGYAAQYKQFQSVMANTTKVFRANNEGMVTFKEKMTNVISKFSYWFSMTRIVMKAVQVTKQMINTSMELESAFTRLQIITGASNAQMEKFVETSSALAQKLGASIKEMSSSIETFSRLGYDLPDASKLAEYATIMSHVADVSVDEATTGITSIIKGYGFDVSEAEHVSDVLIQVGQKYAVSASEMMEAYQKSGAALNATNTSFEKSAGLIAAANASIQNASTVGTALKTVSARIRGSKSDLEELGEDTEGLAESFSKYRGEIQGLTGFDIMKEGSSTEFKDIYDIFEGIAKVWDKLSGTSQSRVSEILGGTRQLQVISSIIGNWDDAAGAYADAMEAAGVATNANSLYMDTANAKLAQLKERGEEFASALFNTTAIKRVLDAGSGLLGIFTKVVEKAGALPTILTTVVGIMAAANHSLVPMFSTATMGKSFKGIISSIQNKTYGQAYTFSEDFASTLKADTQAIQSYAEAVKNFSAKGQTEALRSMSPAAIAYTQSHQDQSGFFGNANAFAQAQQRVEVANMGAVKSFSNMSSILKTYNSAQNGTITLNDGMTMSQQEFAQSIKVGWTNMGEYLEKADGASVSTLGFARSLAVATGKTIALRAASMALNMALSMVVSFAIQGIIKGFDALIHAEENAIKAGQEAAKSISETQKNYEQTKTTVEGLKEKFIELSKGVDLLGNNVSLSEDQYSEWLDMSKQLAELFPGLTDRYNENGDALVILGTNAAEAATKVEELLKAERDAANEDISEKLPEVWKGAKANEKRYGQDFYAETESKLIKAVEKGQTASGIKFDNREAAENFVRQLKQAGLEDVLQFGGYRITSDEFGKGASFSVDMYKSIPGGIATFNDKEKDEHVAKIKSAFDKLREDNGVVDKTKEYYSDVIASLSAWVEGDDSFALLTDKAKEITKTIISNLNYSDFDSLPEVKSHIEDIADKIRALSPELQDALASVFSPETFEGAYSEYIYELDSAMFLVGEKLSKGYDEMLNLTGLMDTRKAYASNMRFLEETFGDGIHDWLGTLTKEEFDTIVNIAPKIRITDGNESLTKQLYNYINASMSGEAIEVGNGLMLREDADAYMEAYRNYVALAEEAQKLGVQFGNINLDNRAAFEWTDANLQKYQDFIRDEAKIRLGQQGKATTGKSLAAEIKEVEKDFKGSISTVLGSWDTFDGIDIAFSPMLQTGDGNAEPLTADTVNSYIWGLIDQIKKDGGTVDSKSLLLYDKKGLKKDGKEIKNLIAAVGKDAKNVAEAMHFGGKDGALSMAYDDLRNIADAYGLTVDSFVESLRAGIHEMDKHYAEFEEASGSDYVDSRVEYSTLGAAYNKDIKDLIAQGWYNDAQVTTFLDTMLNGTARTGDNRADYESMSEKIKGTNFSIGDFFQYDDDGNLTSLGLKNFFDTTKELLGEDFVQIAEDGAYSWDFTGEKIDEVSEKLGVSVEAIDLFQKAMKDVTNNVTASNIASQFDKVNGSIDNSISSLKQKYKDSDLNFNVHSFNVADIDEQRSTLTDFMKEKKMITKDGNIDLKVDGAQEALAILSALEARKRELGDKPAIMRVDTSNLPQAKAEIIETAQSMQSALDEASTFQNNGLTVPAETKASIQQIAETMQSIPKEQLTSLGIDNAEEFQQSISNIANVDASINVSEEDINTVRSALAGITAEDLTVKFGVDAEAVEGYESSDHKAQGTVYWKNWENTVNNFKNTEHKAYGTIIWKNGGAASGNAFLSGLTKTKTRPSPAKDKADRTPTNSNRNTPMTKLLGNAFAKGTWGASHTSNSLVGELGPELIVRGNRFFTVGNNGAEMFKIRRGDIIFNHKQTEDIFTHGHILSGQKRGHSFAKGTAYADYEKGSNAYFPSSSSSSSSSSTSKSYSSTNSNTGNSNTNSNTKEVAEAAKTAIEKFQDEFSDLVDWVEKRLDYLAKKTEKYLDKAEKAVERGDFSGAKSQYNKALGAIAEEIKANKLATEKYEAQGDKVMKSGLAKGLFYGSSSEAWDKQVASRNSIEKKIKRGLLSSDAELAAMFANYSEGKKTVIDEATPFYEAAMEANDKASELIDQYVEVAEKWANIPLDKAQAKIDKLGDKTELNDLWIENAQGYREKNAFIDNDTVYARRERNYNNAAVTESSKVVRNALKKLPKSLLSAAEGGTKKVSTKGYTAGSDDWRAIVRYNKAIDAQRQAEQNAAVSTEEYTKKLRENTKAKFDNIKAEYESKESVKESYAALRKAEKESRDTKGYDQFGDNARKAIKRERYWQKQNLSLQQEELTALQKNYRKNSKKMSAEDRRAAEEEINKLKQEIIETENAVQELTDELNNIKLSKLESEMNRLSAAADKLQDDIDLKNAKGIKTTKKDYENLISNSKKQVTNLTDQNKELQKQQKGLSKTSKKYLELQDRIDQNNASIRQAQKSQAEWNNSIKMLPIEKIDDAIALIESRLGKYKSKLDLNKALDIDSTEAQYIEVWKQYALRLGEEEEKLAEYQANIGKAKKSKDGTFAGKTEEEWRALYNDQVKGIRDTKAEMRELKETMRDDLLWRDWNRALENIKEMRSELSSINSMLSDDMVFNSKGEMTDFGYTKIAALIKDYELAGEAVTKYAEGIRQLASEHKEWWTDADYEEERKEKIGELLGAMKDVQSVQSSLLNLYRSAAQEELDAINKVIEARSKALSAKKEYYDYDKNLKSQNKEVEALEAQIAALNGVAGAEARAKKARLEADLKEKKEALEETVQEHQMEIAQKSLDELRETLTQSFNDGFKDMASDLHKIAEVVSTMGEVQWNESTLVNLFKSLGLSDTGVMSYMKTHASGSRYINASHMGLTQEKGNEILVTKYGMLTPLSRGDGVVPADLTKRLYDLAMNSDLYSNAGHADSLIKMGNIRNEVVQNYDSLIHIDGSADAATVADLKQMQGELLSMATKATTKQLYSGYLKAGGRRVS